MKKFLLSLAALLGVSTGVAQVLPDNISRLSYEEVCSTPVFSPESGSVPKGSLITITTATEGATIHYTIDGTDPTEISTIYSEPIIIVFDVTTIKAIAIKEGCQNSGVATATFTLSQESDAINEVTIDNEHYEYFNLQGIPVRGDITPGLYIRRQGNTTTKILVK
ncbi:MAG: chitobiase/beta-hexosaminidase C-terminal domain-containing protein [Prevotella sp.]